MTPGHGRGCDCRACEKARQYQRDYRARKRAEKGLPPAGRKSNKITIKSPENRERPIDSRLVEDRSGSMVLVHWMPKEGEEWTCPECGRWFMKAPGKGWFEPWVA